MSERRFPTALAWIGFLACMLAGAGLTISAVSSLQILGVALLVLPLLLFGLLSAVYYRRQRTAEASQN